MSGPESGSERSDPLILGTELATASAIEQVRLRTDPPPSQLAGISYDRSAAHVESGSFTETEVDGLLRTRAGRWDQLSADGLAEIRSALSMDDFYTLMTFARRSVVLALRTNDPTWPQGALQGLTAIEYDRVDDRDLSLAAGMVAYALDAVNEDVKAAFQSASDRSGRGTTEVLTRFINQPPWTLADCGYERIGAGTETSLIRRNFEPYEPTRDLSSLARAIGATIQADVYAVESISISERFPSVWIAGSPHEKEAIQSLERFTGCASVRASRPEETDVLTHMFVVFLVELRSTHDANLVARAATDSSGSHARLAVSEGTVCAALISRSVVQSQAGLEDDDSLRRFAAGFTTALRTGETDY